MPIDASTITAAIQNPSDRPGSAAAPLRPASADSWAEFAGAIRSKISKSESSIVTISDAARRVAAQAAENQTTDSNATQPASSAERNLDSLMFDMLLGRKFLGVTAADLLATRSSDANSDLQLRAVEDAARRAGLTIERTIHPTHNSADQNTFQPRGVDHNIESV